MNKLKSRVGQILEANFNGYAVTGLVTKSQYIATRYETYGYPNNSYEIWYHWLKILKSNNKIQIDKTQKWKEFGYAPFDKYIKQIHSTGIWQWNIIK